MNKEEIEKQLKLSKRQNKDERYDYLCSEFNCVNYAINLEKYTNKLQKQNQKYKEVIDKAMKYIQKMFETGFYNDDYYLGHLNQILQDNEVE